MIDLPTALALSEAPGRARFQIGARLRERRPDLLSPGRDISCPPLDTLVRTLLPECNRPESLAVSLRRRAEQVLARTPAGVSVLRLGEPAYPDSLAAIADPPLVLWVRGRVETLRAPAVAVVGARGASTPALAVARDLAHDLAVAGLVVVSGLARGIDGAAHRGALAGGGRTVAVLGCGVDVAYPPEHKGLAIRLSDDGAAVSELPPGTAPHAHHFPLRNRIISGLSLAIVIVEAGERSGALITARSALDQGREVLAVPGNVLSGRNRGAHALIRDGARLVESAADVLEELEWAVRRSARTAATGDTADPVLDALPLDEPVDLDTLAAATQLTPASLLARVTELELAGRLARAPGGRFVRLGR
jgi:DNA processing protein